MIDFAKTNTLTLFDGVTNKNVIKVEDVASKKVLWQAYKYRYVSLGDSIAAGWGVDDRANDSYFGLLRDELKTIYGTNRVYGVNHAEGGDQVRHLMTKLKDPTIRKDVEKADVVTICIGANDALTPVMLNLEEYITAGDSGLEKILAAVEANMKRLDDDNDPNSYMALLNRLYEINPNAKYVFTTIYSPYKYVWLDEGKDGFFKPLLDLIPQMTLLWGAIEVDEYIKDNLLNTDIIQLLFDRINGLDEHSNTFVTQINVLLDKKISEFKDKNSTAKIFIADSKSLWDSVPDRLGAGEVHYNNLVHVKFTRGYTVGDIHWGRLWDNTYIEDFAGNRLSDTVCDSAYTFWKTLIGLYIDDLDFDGLANTLLAMLYKYIFSEDVDPHPDYDGHYMLMRSFADTLRENVPELSTLPALKTITYNANGGSGEMAIQKVAEQALGKKIYSITKANEFNPIAHYHFNGWKDSNGNPYSNEQAIYVPNDIVLNAQWEINKYILTVVQADKSNQVIDPLAVADYPNRKLYVNNKLIALNSEKTTWDKPLSNTETFVVDYGSPIQLSVQGRVEKILPIGNPPKPNCIIKQYNGSDYVQKIVGKLSRADFNMPDRNLTIEYWFNYSANIQYSHSYWDAYIGDKDLKVTYSASND